MMHFSLQMCKCLSFSWRDFSVSLLNKKITTKKKRSCHGMASHLPCLPRLPPLWEPLPQKANAVKTPKYQPPKDETKVTSTLKTIGGGGGVSYNLSIYLPFFLSVCPPIYRHLICVHSQVSLTFQNKRRGGGQRCQRGVKFSDPSIRATPKRRN